MHNKPLTAVMAIITIVFIVTACNSPQKNDPKPGNTDQFTSDEDATPVATTKKDEIHLPDEDLQKGDKGESVRLIQEGLIKIGYSIEATEIFDKNTVWALTDFQLQHENIYTTGLYTDETKKVMENTFKENIIIEPGLGLKKIDDNDETTNIIRNPYEVLALINKNHALPGDYIPSDLVIPNVRFPFTEDLPKKQLRPVAADALEKMFIAADDAKLDLFAQSGYRSYDRQDAIFASNVQQHGEEAANNFSARPGESEHQSGLTMDVTTPDIGNQLIIEFGETDEGIWIKDHASEFGFIIRYPKGKENITKYQFEPWHLRYVGKKAAKEISERYLTLEEYIDTIMK